MFGKQAAVIQPVLFSFLKKTEPNSILEKKKKSKKYFFLDN